jgi:hypothetical protein
MDITVWGNIGTTTRQTQNLAYSNDTGITYNNTRQAPLGAQGEYNNRSIILACAAGRNRVFMVTMTDPVPFILVELIIIGEDLGA